MPQPVHGHYLPPCGFLQHQYAFNAFRGIGKLAECTDDVTLSSSYGAESKVSNSDAAARAKRGVTQRYYGDPNVVA